LSSESRLEDLVQAHLNASGYSTRCQVPLHNRIVDLVARDDAGNIVAVEVKLKQWKRAVRQATASRNSFDFVYVCMPAGPYVEALKNAASLEGVGVMLLDPETLEVRTVLQPEKPKHQWKPNVARMRAAVAGV